MIKKKKKRIRMGQILKYTLVIKDHALSMFIITRFGKRQLKTHHEFVKMKIYSLFALALLPSYSHKRYENLCLPHMSIDSNFGDSYKKLKMFFF